MRRCMLKLLFTWHSSACILEKENLKTIEEVYSALSSDKKIQAQIEKIKSHPWVKVVEGQK